MLEKEEEKKRRRRGSGRFSPPIFLWLPARSLWTPVSSSIKQKPSSWPLGDGAPTMQANCPAGKSWQSLQNSGGEKVTSSLSPAAPGILSQACLSTRLSLTDLLVLSSSSANPEDDLSWSQAPSLNVGQAARLTCQVTWTPTDTWRPTAPNLTLRVFSPPSKLAVPLPAHPSHSPSRPRQPPFFTFPHQSTQRGCVLASHTQNVS